MNSSDFERSKIYKFSEAEGRKRKFEFYELKIRRIHSRPTSLLSVFDTINLHSIFQGAIIHDVEEGDRAEEAEQFGV